MFKFFKELVDSFKEGVAEAKEEMAQEATEEKIIKEKELQEVNDIPNIPYAEKFGTALGAPFRVVIFGDWMTIFNKAEENEKYPVHLYTFGSYLQRAKYEKDLQQCIERDFDIIDNSSAIHTLSAFFTHAGLSKQDTILENTYHRLGLDMWNLDLPGVPAVMASVLSHIISAATDSGYLEKQDALQILDKVIAYAKIHYDNWTDFETNFLIGEQNVGLNNSLGRSVLAKYTKFLSEKKGSPWQNIEW